ncbi:hypothetical protein RRG08_028024 [Elysia crispata]|uniref:Uncharacterized protein n=1 Tax=Elysia crispata TaxID=231223 RepID=A0AAE1BBK8_9GAST|nr:hypothetical protein RRG08_028024 [Elysia crispata]
MLHRKNDSVSRYGDNRFSLECNQPIADLGSHNARGLRFTLDCGLAEKGERAPQTVRAHSYLTHNVDGGVSLNGERAPQTVRAHSYLTHNVDGGVSSLKRVCCTLKINEEREKGNEVSRVICCCMFLLYKRYCPTGVFSRDHAS